MPLDASPAARNDPSRPSTDRVGLPAVAGTLVTGLLVWSTRSTQPVDDAAITFRYATRLATGSGLTYNDGEHVQGFSSAMWALLVALVRAVGIEAPTAAVALGVGAAALAGGLAAVAAHRLAGPVAALGAVILLAASPFRGIASSGMEAPLLVALGLGAILAAADRRDMLGGVLLGLALWAKLDAVAVIAAVAAARWWVDGDLPKRLLATAGAVAAPWYVWATIVYGSPLPQSLTSKLAGRADYADLGFDPLWTLRGIIVLVPALLVATWFVARRRPAARPEHTVTVALAAWFVLHLAAAAVLPLGGRFGWYLTALVAPIAVLGAAGAVQAAADWRSARSPVLPAALIALMVASVTVIGWGIARGAMTAGTETTADDFVTNLRAAGRWIEDNRSDASLETCLGWIAFEAPSARIVDPCQLTTRFTEEEAEVKAGPPDTFGADGYCEIARFDRGRDREGAQPPVIVVERCGSP